MIKLTVIDNDTDHFVIKADEPVTIETSLLDGTVVTHIYRGTEVTELSDPLGAYDGSIKNISRAWEPETDIEDLKPLKGTGVLAPNERPFPWGPIQRTHHIGRYDIVEYIRDNSKLHFLPEEEERVRKEHGATFYHAYVDGQDTSRSFHSLEAAIVDAIAHAHDGINTKAGTYFCRMIGLTDAT